MYVTPFVTVGWDRETGGYSGEYGVNVSCLLNDVHPFTSAV